MDGGKASYYVERIEFGISQPEPLLNNCLNDPGRNWTNVLTKTYLTSPSSPWAKAAPQLINFCGQTNITWNGTLIECNPVGKDASGTYPTQAQSGNCSGLPTSNCAKKIVLDRPSSGFRFFNNLYLSPAGGSLSTGYAFAINTVNVVHYTNVSAQVNDVVGGDFGVASTSPLYNEVSNFVSCPRSQVGIQSTSTSTRARTVSNLFISGVHVHAIIGRNLPDTYPKDGYEIDSHNGVVGHHVVGGHHRNGGLHIHNEHHP